MQEKTVTISFPEWLVEAAQAAAQRQGIYFEDMLRLAAYEYVEKHLHDRLSDTHDGIPAYVRMANAVLVAAIDKKALVVRLIQQGSSLSVIIQTEEAGHASEIMSLPSHLKPHLYDRLVTMASGKAGMQGSIPLLHNGKNYQVLLSWNGDYRSQMVLQIVYFGAGNGA